MNDEEREQFEAMQSQLRELRQLIEGKFGDRPEGIAQVIVQNRSDGAVSVGGTVRVVTNQGPLDFLIK